MSIQIQNHYNKTDESFNPAVPGNYDLVMQVSDSEVSYSVVETNQNRFVALGVIRMPIEQVLNEYSWLKGNFHSVRIIVENNLCTMVPAVFFDPAEKGKYLSFTVEYEASSIVGYDHVASLDLYSVYIFPGRFHSNFMQTLPSARIQHISTALIESILGNYKNLMRDRQVFIHVRKENFDLVVFDNRQLSYFNAFSYSVPEDLAYYVIFVFEQLGLNPEETSVILMGKPDRNSPEYDLLYKYIRNLSTATRNEACTYSYVFRDVPGQAFYTLLNPGS